MQDTYRQLLDMQNEIDRVKKLDKDSKKLSKTSQEHQEKLKEIDISSNTFQDNTERNFRTLSKAIDDESATRELENKKIKKVMQEIEKRQKQIEYDTKLAV